MGAVLDGFISAQEHYLIKLAEDHSVAALGLLADIIRSNGAVAQTTLVSSHFGDAYYEGQEAVKDLVASGLVRREGEGVTLSAELLRAVRSVREYIRVPAFEVPAADSRCLSDAAWMLYEAENALRKLIIETLGALDAAWWPGRVPAEFAAAAELRRRAEFDSSAVPDHDFHPIMYLTLGELFEIVLSSENWEHAFSVALRRTAAMTRDAAGDMLAVRNKVAHSRPVSASDVSLLASSARRLHLIE
jgi:hypothetical protein